MKNIIFLSQDLLVGGAQRHTVGLCLSLKSSFNPLLVIHAKGVSDKIVPKKIEKSITILNQSGLLNPLKWIQIAREIVVLRPSIVVSINQIATILAMFGKLCGIIRCPVVSIFHTTDIRNGAGWIRTIPYIFVVWFSDALVYISKNQSRIWTRRGLVSKRVEVIRNGIELTGLTQPNDQERLRAKRSLGFSPSDFVIGSLAVFRSEKNHLQLIDALAILREVGISAKVLLVGDGPMRSKIESKVQALCMTEHVHFAGEQRDVRCFILAMDVGVLTSLAVETLSLAALETMALGVPMVMSEIGGASEIITEGKEGYLYPAGDTAKLVDKLKLCANPNHARMLGENAARKVREEFDHQKMCDAYRDLFQELIAESRAKSSKHSR